MASAEIEDLFQESPTLNDNNPNVLDIGQCSFDHENISRMLSKEFSAHVVQAATGDEAFRAVRTGHYDLVLVNRIFDTDGTSGLDLIQRLQSDEETRTTPVMLVSNHAEAQDAAVTAGAKRGFGKDTLTNSETRDVLAALLDH